MPLLLLAAALVTAACGSGNGIGGETGATTPSAGGTDDEAAPVPAPGGDSTDAVVSSRGGDLLRAVQERGRLVCGVSGTRVIFSETQPDGSVVGVDADGPLTPELGDGTAAIVAIIVRINIHSRLETGGLIEYGVTVTARPAHGGIL